ncbi:MAG TPA: phosphoribosylglycinamide formyltransferase, partial [Spartobacteria bacterium]|nr:phosphoribosylglycinamide formyltransferase [Spartobacteria bacterium]
RILNIHPSLLPKYPGLEAWKQALAAGEKITGCTVHYVDERIDHGDIIAQREVPILPNDTPETLHARIQVAESALYPAAIAELCRS